MDIQQTLSAQQLKELLNILRDRFEKNMHRHKGIKWENVHAKLDKSSNEKLWSLNEMEITGGEPDIVLVNIEKFEKGKFTFCDCSAESPKGRRSLCYDLAALKARKENKPKNNAVSMATSMGIELLTEEEYRELQKLGNFDTKTSSWLKTPAEIRKLGGAIFADFRYNNIFIYHNGAESYYAARGFRGLLRF